MKQKTIKNELSFSGIGLHTAVIVNITLKPAPENTGIVFRRSDLKKDNEVSALYNQVSSTMLGTVIEKKAAKVQTIEHLMAGIWATDIDNLIVEIDNYETPIMDGSALSFIQEIQNAGIQEQNEERKFLVVQKEIEVADGKKLVKITPADDFQVDIEVDFNYGGIGEQIYHFDGDKETFIKEVALARTFCNFAEIENMQKVGFAKGGFALLNLDSVAKTDIKQNFLMKILSIFKKGQTQAEVSEVEKLFNEGKITENAAIYDNDKILNKSGVRCDYEVAKHKMLDLIGDLYTGGYNIKGHVKAKWNGHTLHNKFLKTLFSNPANYVIK
ncbi:MAG: hypothetical protein Ta2D_06210 [Rickettsiales bacterium]|nr:MAG: hypothetical protein Ta2D_06210 [Rickettsiales bacterium]